MTNISFFHTNPPTPSDTEFNDWLTQSGIRWTSLNSGERNTVKNLFIRKRSENFESKLKKARPLLRKNQVIGKPKPLAPNKIASEQLHKRILNIITSESSPSTRIFLNVSAPNMSGSQPYVILQGKTLLVIDARNWESQSTYTISKEFRVIKNNQYFDQGSLTLPVFLRNWKTILPSDFKIIGLVVFCYGQAQFIKPEYKTPFSITDLKGLKTIMKNTCDHDDYSDEISLYVSTLLMRYM